MTVDEFIELHRNRLEKLCETARELAHSENEEALDEITDYELMKILIKELDLINYEYPQ